VRGGGAGIIPTRPESRRRRAIEKRGNEL